MLLSAESEVQFGFGVAIKPRGRIQEFLELAAPLCLDVKGFSVEQ